MADALRVAAPAAKAASGSEAESAAESAENKRYRQAIDDVADVYVCPITAELPIDPVTAEDGRCYERWAIEEWFAKAPNQFQGQVKSPVTNEMMGKRLVPAVQVRNTLKRLVESGAISGSKADAWKKAMAEEAERWKEEEERSRPGGEGFHEAKSRFEGSVAESAGHPPPGWSVELRETTTGWGWGWGYQG